MVTLEQVQQARADYREVLATYHKLTREEKRTQEGTQLKEKYLELYRRWHKMHNRREYEMKKARQLAKASV